MSKDIERDPYAEGMDAAHKGGMAAQCPYDYSSADGQEWLRGFEDGGGEE